MVTSIHSACFGLFSGITLQYLVLDWKAFLGMKHFIMEDTVKYIFQKRPMKAIIAKRISTMTLPTETKYQMAMKTIPPTAHKVNKKEIIDV